jgi:hypothetical protein
MRLFIPPAQASTDGAKLDALPGARCGIIIENEVGLKSGTSTEAPRSIYLSFKTRQLIEPVCPVGLSDKQYKDPEFRLVNFHRTVNRELQSSLLNTAGIIA